MWYYPIDTYYGMLAVALIPRPFFSVLNTSQGANWPFWNRLFVHLSFTVHKLPLLTKYTTNFKILPTDLIDSMKTY